MVKKKLPEYCFTLQLSNIVIFYEYINDKINLTLSVHLIASGKFCTIYSTASFFPDKTARCKGVLP